MENVLDTIKLKRGPAKGESLYKQIGSQLKREIESGKIEPGHRLPAFTEMVDRLHVDYRIIKSAMNLLEDEGLIRCEAGRGKGPLVINGSARTRSIGLIRWDHDSFALEITEGIRRFAKEKRLNYSIIDVSRLHENVSDITSHIVENKDGIIILPTEIPHYQQILQQMFELEIESVFVDRFLEGVPEHKISIVSIDHIGGAYQATKHLLSLYGRPVYFMGHTTEASSARDRLRGWRIAMEEYGFSDSESYVLSLPQKEPGLAEHQLGPSMQRIREEARNLLRGKKEQEFSIFAAGDAIAQGACLEAAELGMRIGKNVCIVGFGDYPLCQNMPVPLSSVFQANELVGYETAKLLYAKLIGEIKQPVHRIVPAELRIRQSSTGVMTIK